MSNNPTKAKLPQIPGLLVPGDSKTTSKQTKQSQKKHKLFCSRCNAKFKHIDPEQKYCLKHRQTPLKGGTVSMTTSNTSEKTHQTSTTESQTQEATEAVATNQTAIKPTLTLIPTDTQSLVDEMMWQHGTNLAQRGDYYDLLRAAGLHPSDVSKKILDKAEQNFHLRLKAEGERPRPESDNKLTWSLEPVHTEQWTNNVARVWEDKSGRYRVYQIKAKIGNEVSYASQFRSTHNNWMSCDFEKTEGTGYPKYVTNLEAAFLQAEKFHSDRAGIVCLHSNRTEVIEKAIELNFITRSITPTRKARKVKMQSISNVDGQINETTNEVVVQEVDGQVVEVKKEKKAKTPKAPKAPKTPKEGVERDQWGVKVGCQAWHINRAFTVEGDTLAELVAKTGLQKSRVNSHMAWAVKNGIVIKDGAKYKLVNAPTESQPVEIQTAGNPVVEEKIEEVVS